MDDLKQDLAALRIDRNPTAAAAPRAGVVRGSRCSSRAAGGRAGTGSRASVRSSSQVATATERPAGTQAAVLNASGYVRRARRATVSSKITGKVVEVNVEEGKAVSEGQILARLDDSTARAALGLAEAQAEAARRSVAENEVRLAEARLTLGRLQQLRQRGLCHPGRCRSGAGGRSIRTRRASTPSRQQILVAERQIEVQRTDLDSTIIRAPFSGVAISKDAQPGEMVSPISAGGGFTRTGICTIVDMRSLEIEVDVNEAYINRVSRGQDVSRRCSTPIPTGRFPARVITMVPTADRQKATVLVRIAFKALDPRILPDMGVKVTFLREDRDTGARRQPRPAGHSAALVPKDAIRTDNGRYLLWSSMTGLAERRAVETAAPTANGWKSLAGLRTGRTSRGAVPAGLNGGERVAAKGQGR